jgi:hypothetical protein
LSLYYRGIFDLRTGLRRPQIPPPALFPAGSPHPPGS